MVPTGMMPCESDAVLILAATSLTMAPYNRSALVRIDRSNGDIKWQTRINHGVTGNASLFYFFIKGLVKLRDGSFIVLADTITEEGDIGFIINRILADGSVLWYREYGIPDQAIFSHYNG
jgi:hypothetical protein